MAMSVRAVSCACAKAFCKRPSPTGPVPCALSWSMSCTCARKLVSRVARVRTSCDSTPRSATRSLHEEADAQSSRRANSLMTIVF